jgi:hypothetical protein
MVSMQEDKETGGPGAIQCSVVGALIHGAFYGFFTVLKNMTAGETDSV